MDAGVRSGPEREGRNKRRERNDDGDGGGGESERTLGLRVSRTRARTLRMSGLIESTASWRFGVAAAAKVRAARDDDEDDDDEIHGSHRPRMPRPSRERACSSRRL